MRSPPSKLLLLYIFFLFLTILIPALAINVTITQTAAAKSNNSLYNATIFLHPSNFANDTNYNITVKFASTSFSNNSEQLGTILLATLNFFNMPQQNTNQTLSAIIKNEYGALQSNATVNGIVIAPNGGQAQINFTETATGNYTYSFLFDQIGNYTIAVSVTKTGFNNITGSKNIYVGLIEFASFTGIDVFQSTTAYFDLGLRNKGNMTSTVVPFLYIYNAAGTLVFSIQGLSSTVSAGQNVSLFQHNTLAWSVGSTAAGVYNATAYLRFTDTTNTTAQTSNRSVLFQVRAVPTTTTTTTSGGGGGTTVTGGTYIIVQNETQAVVNVPTPEFVQFINIPILIEAYPSYRTSHEIVLFNPTDVDINNIRMSVNNIPENWFTIDKDTINLPAQDADTISINFIIPQDAPPGNYQGTFSFSNAEYLRDFAFIVRVNQVLPGQTSLVTKESVVQEVAERTNFVINIKNRNTFLESLRITEKIDKDIANHVSEVEFSIQPSKVVQADPIVQWTLTNLLPNEERNITYKVKKTINTTKPFIYTSIEELVSVERVSEVLPLTINIYDIAVIIPIAVLFIIVLLHRIRKSRTRESMSEARRLAERLRGG